MELMRAASDAIGGVLCDQWTDFSTVPDRLHPTGALFAAIQRGADAGRGVNLAQRTISSRMSPQEVVEVRDGLGSIVMTQPRDRVVPARSDRRADRDRSGRAHSFGELAETGSVDGHTQTGIQA